MADHDPKLAKALKQVREELASAAKHQQAENERQRNGGSSRFRLFGRKINVHNEPYRLVSHQREESQKSKLDAEMVRWTGVVAIYTRALVFVGVLGTMVGVATLWVIKGQLVAMETDQRLWIDIAKIVVAKDVVFYSEGAYIELGIELSNAGKAPALTIDPWISPYIENGFGVSGAPKRFTKPEMRPIDQGKNILFPNIPIQRTVTGFVPANQIDQVLKTENRWFDVTIDLCVDYRYPTATISPKTCHILKLVRIDGKIIQLAKPLGAIAKDSLKVTYFPFGGLAY
jgi:hypothetical protein